MTRSAGWHRLSVSTQWASPSFALTHIWKACEQIDGSQNCFAAPTERFPEKPKDSSSLGLTRIIADSAKSKRLGCPFCLNPRPSALIRG